MYSRRPSTSSVHGTPSSSNQNTDEEYDSGDNKPTLLRNYKERRREAHSQAEQKRRDAIKKGYDLLQDLVPTCQQTDSTNHKLSKAAVLQKSIDYIQYLLIQRRKQEDERNSLRKDVIALQIMQSNYEQIVKAQSALPGQSEQQLTDQDRFNVLCGIMDELYESFKNVPADNFSELSAAVFNWLEQYCKPQSIREIVQQVLRDQKYV